MGLQKLIAESGVSLAAGRLKKAKTTPKPTFGSGEQAEIELGLPIKKAPTKKFK